MLSVSDRLLLAVLHRRGRGPLRALPPGKHGRTDAPSAGRSLNIRPCLLTAQGGKQKLLFWLLDWTVGSALGALALSLLVQPVSRKTVRVRCPLGPRGSSGGAVCAGQRAVRRLGVRHGHHGAGGVRQRMQTEAAPAGTLTRRFRTLAVSVVAPASAGAVTRAVSDYQLATFLLVGRPSARAHSCRVADACVVCCGARQANLLTGAVNLSIHTLLAPDHVALAIVSA